MVEKLWIKKLQVENFRNINHEEFHLKNSPVMIIFDENGSGKTTLHEAILWSLCGEIYRYNENKAYGSIDSFFNLRANRKRISVTAQLMMGDTPLKISINRPKRRKTYLTKSQKPDLMFAINDEILGDEEFFRHMTQLLNQRPQTIQMTNFLSQELINEKLIRNEKTQGQVFSEILSFSWMQQIYDRIQEEISDLKRKINYYDRKIALHELELAHSPLNELWQSLHAQASKMKNDGYKFRDETISYLDLLDRELEFAKLIDDVERIELIHQRINEIENAPLPEIDTRQSLIYFETKLNQFREELGKLETLVRGEEASSQPIIEWINEFFQNEEELQNFEEQLKPLREKLEKVRKRKTSLPNDLEKIDGEISKWSDFQSEIKSVVGESKPLGLKELETIKSSLEVQNEQLKKQHVELDRLQQEIQGILKEKSLLEDQLKQKELRVKQIKIGDLETAKKDLNELARKMNIVFEDGDDTNLNELLERTRHLQERLSQIDIETIQEEIDRLKQLQEKQDSAARLSQNYFERKKTAEELLNGTKNKIESLKTKIAELNVAKQEEINGPDYTKIQIAFAFVFLGFSLILLYYGNDFLSVSLAIMLTFFVMLLVFPILLPQPFGKIGILRIMTPVSFRISKIDDQLFDLQQQLFSEKENLQKQQLELEKIEHELQKLGYSKTDFIPEISEKENTVATFRQDRKKLKKLAQDFIQEIERQEIERTIDDLKQKIEQLDTEIKRNLMGKEINDISNPISTLEKERINLTQKIQKNSEMLTSIEKSLTRYLNRNPKIKTIDEQTTLLDNKKDTEAAIASLQKEEEELIQKITDIDAKQADLEKRNKFLKSEILKVISQYKIEENQWQRENLTRLVKEKFEESKNRKKWLEEIIKKSMQLKNELNEIVLFLEKKALLQEEVRKNQRQIEQAQSMITHYENKKRNAEMLQNAWKSVNIQIKNQIDQFSKKIVENIEGDFQRYFDLLGGHDRFDYTAIDIRMSRNSIKVSLAVGENNENAGSPFALLSNGQQVCLVHALFFAMAKWNLKQNPLRYVGLDEPTQYLDTRRKQAFIGFLGKFIEEVNNQVQLIITTADREFLQFALESKNENFTIVSMNEIKSGEFTEFEGSWSFTPPRGILDEVQKEEDHELSLPRIEPPKPQKSPDVIVIDETIEVDCVCSVCQGTFKSFRKRTLCDKKECISEYRRSMMIG